MKNKPRHFNYEVISTDLYADLYAFVRRPMYAEVLVMMIGVPLAPGSWWRLAMLALMMPILVWRMLDEEKLLSQDLPG